MRPDGGQAPLGGGCTGGSHNRIVLPNPEHITLEYVHHQQHSHKKKASIKRKGRARPSFRQASHTLSVLGNELDRQSGPALDLVGQQPTCSQRLWVELGDVAPALQRELLKAQRHGHSLTEPL